MNELKILLVATAGGMFVQSIDPLPVLPPSDSVPHLVVRMLISVAGGIVSTLAFKLVQQLPWRKWGQKWRQQHNVNFKN